MKFLRAISPVDWLLLALPAAFAIRFVPGWRNDTLLFVITALGLIPLAAWMSCATEHLSDRAGSGVGGLLNATFSNAPELIISLIALSKGLTSFVKAVIVGSILGNILLMLGIAIFAGGLRFHHLRFNQTGTRVAATSLCLATIGLIIPTVFHWSTERLPESWSRGASQHLSLVIAVTLLATYVLWLIFSLLTHKELFKGPSSEELGADAPCKSPWPVAKAIAVLGVTTILVAALSEFLADSVQPACESMGLTQAFVGIIVVAILGNAGEATAVLVAMKNKMDLSLNIAIGSSLQVALFVTPLLVLASHPLGQPMTLQFSIPETVAIALAVGIVMVISGDGECNWVEGAQLISVYVIIASLFYFLPTPEVPAKESAQKDAPVVTALSSP